MHKTTLIALILAVGAFAVYGEADWLDYFPKNYVVDSNYVEVLNKTFREGFFDPSKPEGILEFFQENKEKSLEHRAFHYILKDLLEKELDDDDVLRAKLTLYVITKKLYKQLDSSDQPMIDKMKLLNRYLDSKTESKFRKFFQKGLFGKSRVTRALKLVEKEPESNFDEILIQGYGLSPFVGDEELFERAKSLSFNDATFNFTRIAELADTRRAPSLPWAVYDLLNGRCAYNSQESLGLTFFAYNLAREIDSKDLQKMLERLPVKFKKLNEYQRICLAITAPLSRVKGAKNYILDIIFERIGAMLTNMPENDAE